MRRTRVLSALALVGIVGAFAAPASADGPTIGATPNKKLADGQQVMVSASGFAPDTLMAVVECPTATVSPDECDIFTVMFASTDDSGAYAGFPYTVSRILSDGTDCALNGGCYIGTQDQEGVGPTASTLIRFDPNIPPLPPLEIHIRFDKTPSVNDKGVVGLRGHLECKGRGSEVQIETDVRQIVDRAIFESYGDAEVPCAADTTVPFRMTIRPTNGLFGPGPAVLRFQAFSLDGRTSAFGRRGVTLQSGSVSAQTAPAFSRGVWR